MGNLNKRAALKASGKLRIIFFRFNRVDGLARDVEFVGQVG